MRESIVLQLGNYSNYVGSHFWNIQSSSAATGDGTEEGDMENYEGSRLYRRSREASSGYVPRVLMGDLPENTGHVLIVGESTVATAPKARVADDADNSENVLLWDGTTRRIQKDHYPVHPFQTYQQTSARILTGMIDPTSRDQDFFSERFRDGVVEGYERPDERTIKTWCDYMGTPVHSKSYLDLPLQYNSQNFDHFAAALNHDRTSMASVVDQYLESFRYFAEECDTLTSVQVFADCYDGFSVLTRELVQEIREDYRGVAIPVWAITDAPLAHTMDGSIWRANRDTDIGNGLKNTLRNLSFSYSAASLFDGGASAIIPISGTAAALSVDMAYTTAAAAAAAAAGTMSTAGIDESKLRSPHRPSGAPPPHPLNQNLRYTSSSVVAAGIDGVLSVDLLRRSSLAQRAADFINSREAEAGDERFHRKSGGLSGSSSGDDIREILYHATNAGRFPCLALETALPFSSSPSALMNRIDSQFTSPVSSFSHAPARGGGINPFLYSLSAAQHFADATRRKWKSKSGRGQVRSQSQGNAKVVEEEAVASFFDEAEDEDVMAEGYWLSAHPGGDGLGDDTGSIRSTLSNVLCVRGAIAKEQFGFDKYLWAKAMSMEGYDDYGKDLSSRRYFLTRCLQRQTDMRVPLSFPTMVTTALAQESSHREYNGGICTITALGADAATTPNFLGAHAAMWEAGGGRRGGAMQSQLHKVGMAAEDAKEIAESLRMVAGNYKDELM